MAQGLRCWAAGIRQIVESVYDKLFNAFGLWRERPHELSGLRARLAARIALHNFSIWLNEQLDAPGPPSPTRLGGDLETHTKVKEAGREGVAGVHEGGPLWEVGLA